MDEASCPLPTAYFAKRAFPPTGAREGSSRDGGLPSRCQRGGWMVTQTFRVSQNLAAICESKGIHVGLSSDG